MTCSGSSHITMLKGVGSFGVTHTQLAQSQEVCGQETLLCHSGLRGFGKSDGNCIDGDVCKGNELPALEDFS